MPASTLTFIRHGIAVDRQLGLVDADRRLTKKGRERTAAIAQWLYDRGERYQWLACSPFWRARETAEILLAAKLTTNVEILPVLAPGGDFEAFLEELQTRGMLSAIALVGHQPDLSEWMEVAVWGRSSGKLQLKKAGIGRVGFPDGRCRAGAGILEELLTPKSMLIGAD